MYKQIQKALDWGVKIASLAITAPATWIVATQLFSDVQIPALLFAMRFAAVFLIEGVLLSNWLLLEFDTRATPEIKVRYGLTALAMYVALLVIGWRHEGPTGLVFRVALLAALIASGWDTYVMTWQRATAKVDRTVEASGKVRRHARKLSIREAILQRESEHAATLALISAEGEAAREGNALYGERLLAELRVEDRAERGRIQQKAERLARSIAANSNGNGNGNGNGQNGKSDAKKLTTVELPELDSGAIESASLGSAGSDLTDDRLLTLSILEGFDDDPSISRTALAQKLGVGRGRLSRLVNDMIQDGLLMRDGRSHYLTDDGDNLVTHGSVRITGSTGKHR